MKRPVVSVVALAMLAGMTTGRLLAEGQPAAKFFSVAQIFGEQGGSTAQPGYMIAASQPGGGAAFGSAPAGSMPSYGPPGVSSYNPGGVPSGALGSASPCAPGYATPGATSCFSADGTDDGCDPAEGAVRRTVPFACRWKVAVGAVFLYRMGSSSSQMVVRDFLSGDEVLNAQSVQADWGSGPQIDAMYNLGYRWNLELLYFNVNNWERDHTISSPSFARFQAPGLGEDFLFSDVTSHYASRLHNAEANLRWHCLPHVITLAGFRFMDLREEAELIGSDVNSGLLPADTAATLTNNLYGLQIGAGLDFWGLGRRFHFKPMVKAGICENQIRRSATQSTVFGEWSSLHDTGNHPSFVGEVGVMATYRLTPHLGLFAQCEAMWLTGVALASDNLSVLGTIHADNDASFLGAQIGLQGKW